jgi:hypothetical protein
MATCYLSQIPEVDKWVGSNAELSGRNLQPWRNVLTVAKWLEETGVPGLYQKMHNLALKYQKERPELELPDITRLVIQALCKCASSAIRANSAINKGGHFEIKISDVSKAALSLVKEEELDIDQSKVTNRKIGSVMSKLRFLQVPRSGGMGSRLRKIDFPFLVQLAKSYNVDLSVELAHIDQVELRPHGGNGTDGTNGTEELPLDSSISELISSAKPNNPCSWCGSMDYWQRFDGAWVCNVCHQ